MAGDADLAGTVHDDAVRSDAELITAVRSGDTSAFGTLFERHGAAAQAVARQYARSQADAEDITSDAFAKVLAVIAGGGGPDTAFRAYLFTVVRRLAFTTAQGVQRLHVTDDVATFESAFGPAGSVEEPALEGFERTVVARAYDALPERWQAVLWYTEIEGMTAAQIAPLLGLSANGVAALTYRAREGLRQGYLQAHLTSAPTPQCADVVDKLGAYVRGGLSARDTRPVEAHLEGCTECRALVLELGDVNHGMRAIVAPLVLGVAGLAAFPGLGAIAGAGAAGAAAAGGGAPLAPDGLPDPSGAAGTSGVSASHGVAGAGSVAPGGASAAASGGGVAALVAGAPLGALVAAAALVVGIVGFSVAAALGVFGPDASPTTAAAGPELTLPSDDRRGASTPDAPYTSDDDAPDDDADDDASDDVPPREGPDARDDDGNDDGRDDGRDDDGDDDGRDDGRDDDGRDDDGRDDDGRDDDGRDDEGRDDDAPGDTPDTPGPDPQDPDEPVDPTPEDPGTDPEDPDDPIDPNPDEPADPEDPEDPADPTPDDPDEPTGPPVLGLPADRPGITLTAGAQGSIAFAITNSGPAPATDLTAVLTLPDGVSPVVADLAVVRPGAATASSARWSCGAASSIESPRCTLPELAAGATAELAVDVVVDARVPAGEVSIDVVVSGPGLETVNLSVPAVIEAATSGEVPAGPRARVTVTPTDLSGQDAVTARVDVALESDSSIFLAHLVHARVPEGVRVRPELSTEAGSDVCLGALLGDALCLGVLSLGSSTTLSFHADLPVVSYETRTALDGLELFLTAALSLEIAAEVAIVDVTYVPLAAA